MNEKSLKAGLRELVNEGWFVVSITDKSVESLFDRKGKQPSEKNQEALLIFTAGPHSR